MRFKSNAMAWRPMTKTAPYLHWRRIPFGHTDAAAIVYTPRFSDYCMEAVEVWFRDCIGIDWYRINTELGWGTPVVHMELDFKAPLKGGDRLGIVVRVAGIGRSTVTVALEGIRELSGESPLACEPRRMQAFSARFVFCFAKLGQGAIPVSQEQRALLEAYQQACEAAVSEAGSEFESLNVL
mgnify:CR=1 FL=1